MDKLFRKIEVRGLRTPGYLPLRKPAFPALFAHRRSALRVWRCDVRRRAQRVLWALADRDEASAACGRAFRRWIAPNFCGIGRKLGSGRDASPALRKSERSATSCSGTQSDQRSIKCGKLFFDTDVGFRSYMRR
eukprot:scaffold5763_cov249-Pinguiococcus_pyrenoidosus.AAC.4